MFIGGNIMIKIQKIKIENFRSIKSILLNFDNYSVLVGKNNSGKSNIVQAINKSFDFSNIEKEDVHSSISDPFDVNKKVIIEIKIVPVNIDGNTQKNFSDKWSLAFGSNISLDPLEDKEYFAFRSEYTYNEDKESFVCKKNKINDWNDERPSSLGTSINRATLECIEHLFINAQRDLSLDVNDKKSFWSQTTSNINIPNDIKEKIEKQLDNLNSKIVKGSEILLLMKKTLESTTADKESKIDISPITKDIDTIYRGMNIYYSDEYKSFAPIDSLGLGVRSWGVFSSVKAYITAKTKKKKELNKAYFPFLLIEEPEAHIHPQAQRHLLKDIKEIAGQKVITTHSPYIVSQVQLEKIIYVKKIESNTEIVPLIIDNLTEEDKRKINRVVMNTRGEILYANAVILVEGETEEQALAVYFREYFKKEPFEMGISIVGVGGTNYLPFIRLLKKLEIKWYIFSDGEENPIDEIKCCMKKLNNLPSKPKLNIYDNIFVLDNGDCIEKYYIRENYIKEIKKAFDIVEQKENHIRDYMLINHGNNKKGGIKKDYRSSGGENRAIEDCLLESKTKYATEVANQICKIRIKTRKIPLKINQLFLKIEEEARME